MDGNIILLLLALCPMLGGVACYVTGRRSKKIRDYMADFITAAEFVTVAVLAIMVYGGDSFAFSLEEICGLGISLKLDGFRALYAAVAAFMWMMTTIFSKEYFKHYRNRNRYYLFMLITFGATMGVFLSADLFTTFIFFEIMSISSYCLVIHDEKPRSMRAGDTYLAIAVIGGMVLLMGLFLLNNLLGTLDIDKLHEAAAVCSDKVRLYVAGGLLLFGFGAKAGMFPLHVWLPESHPVAPAPASALLSGILTKSGVFGILVISSEIFLHDGDWGMAVLCTGVITMFLGAVLGVFSVNLKRTLACSSMSQIGFILVGIGMQGLLGAENSLAVRGTLLHMVNHSVIKLVLFMAAGVVYMNLHKLELNEIRGFGRNKPLLKLCFLSGALAIGGIPLFSGYISKTLLHEGIVEYIGILGGTGASTVFFTAVEWIFLISGGLTVAYMLKLYIAIFVEKGPGEKRIEEENGYKTKYMNRQSSFALAASAVLLPLLGLLPSVLMEGIAGLGEGFMHGMPPEASMTYFSLENLKGALISIFIGIAVYILLVRRFMMQQNIDGTKHYADRWPAWLSLENMIYRPVLLNVLPFVFGLIFRVLDRFVDGLLMVMKLPFTLMCELNRRIFKNYRIKKALKEADITGSKEGKLAISQSLSFGLMLFGVGFIAALIYMILTIG